MPELSAADQAKLDALLGTILAGRSPRVAEVVAVSWPPPTGTVYYASTQADEVCPGLKAKLGHAPVEARLANSEGEPFLKIVHEESLSDDELEFDLWDADGRISDLFYEHGAGVRVEIFYYFEDVGLLLSQWWGHLQPPEEAGAERFVATAAFGFLSAMLPLPRRAFFVGCQAVDGLLLKTQAEIDEGDCPRDMHLGGSVGVPGMEFHPCPRNSRADCTAHVGDSLSFLAFDTTIEAIANRVGGRTYLEMSRGNETNLKKALRVIAGRRKVRDLDVIRYTAQTNAKNPDQGYVRAEFAAGEGPWRAMWNCAVNDAIIGEQHLNKRLGERRQPPTNFSPNANNDSGTAKFFAVYGPTNPSNHSAATLRGSCDAEGSADVRVYASETAFTEEYSTDRAWWLLHALRNKRWGYGLDVARAAIETDFIPLSAWTQQTVAVRLPDGTLTTAPRSTFNAELTDRSVQQQINDICAAGRFSPPFPHEGKLRVVPLAKVADLSACPLFTDYGGDRNICVDENGRSTLTRSIVTDANLPNRLVINFEDAAKDFVERPLTFEDVGQQLRAGHAFGDTTRRVVEKKYSLLGVTNYPEAVRLGNLYLDLGEFDEGGLRNNLRISFTTWFAFTLTLHKYMVIRVLSKQLERYRQQDGATFEYFRIRSITRLPNLKVRVSAQAYPVDYFEESEDLTVPPAIQPGDGADNPGGRPGGRPGPGGFGDFGFENDRIHFRLIAA